MSIRAEAIAAAHRDLDGSKLERVLRLLDVVDFRGELAERIVTTGDPAYAEAFFQAVATGEPDQEALAPGHQPGEGGFRVPYFADPTFVGSRQSDLRRISRVENTTAQTWQGLVFSGGALNKLDFKLGRVQSYIPISGTGSVSAEKVLQICSDASYCEEGSFVRGGGSCGMPRGVVGSLPARCRLGSVSAVSTQLLPEQFRPGASILVNKKTCVALMPEGVPILHSSAMRLGDVLIGDFSQFLIVDQIGTSVEFVPPLGDDGKRGIYAVWSNGSTILVPDAFRLVTVS